MPNLLPRGQLAGPLVWSYRAALRTFCVCLCTWVSIALSGQFRFYLPVFKHLCSGSSRFHACAPSLSRSPARAFGDKAVFSQTPTYSGHPCILICIAQMLLECVSECFWNIQTHVTLYALRCIYCEWDETYIQFPLDGVRAKNVAGPLHPSAGDRQLFLRDLKGVWQKQWCCPWCACLFLLAHCLL